MTDEDKVQKSIELRNTIHTLGKVRMLKSGTCELKPAEKHVIFMLANVYEGKPAKPSEIAKKLGVTLSAVSHHINALEKSEYIERVQDPTDKRILRVSLSEKGRELDELLKKKFFKKICDMVEFLGEEDSDELIRLVKRVSDYLENHMEVN